MISPDFWTDSAMIRLPMPVRLFYIGTWNFACSAGHLPDDPLQLKLKVLPADDVDAEAFVQALVDAGRMERITLRDGSKYLAIPSFPKHQKQDSRYQSRCPACRDTPNLTKSPASFGESSETHRISRLGGGGGGGGVGDKGEGESRASALTPPAPYCSKHPGGTKERCGACGDARRAFEAWKAAQAAKPTPTPRRPPMCPLHDEYPLPCDKCARIAAEQESQ